MAIDVLNTGTAAGSGDGESLRSAMTKVNSNFGVAENAASKIVQASSADTTADKVMLTDHAWRGAQLGDYFTYGGTANAITLTSANLRAGGTLIKGMKFRFEATTPNTGATTIAVDGGSAIACVTPTGVALPAGFIRTDVFTECEYDGSNFVVSRKVERGSNANGNWTRWEDGSQTVTGSISPASNNNNGTTVTYAAPFSGVNSLVASTDGIASSALGSSYVAEADNVSTTQGKVKTLLHSAGSISDVTGVTISYTANGQWY